MECPLCVLGAHFYTIPKMEKYKISESTSVSLDLLRSVSAQAVVVGHGISLLGIFKKVQNPAMQNIAVLIFFILSGFLITYATLEKDNFKFKFFLIDRFSRIYTAFIPAAFFVVIVDVIGNWINPLPYTYYNSLDIKTFIGNLLMLQDYPFVGRWITSLGSGRPFWTLAIEWWIYLSFGYLVLVFLKKEKLTIINYIIMAFLSVVPLYNFFFGRGDGLTVYWIFGFLIYILFKNNSFTKINLKSKVVIFSVLLVLAVLRIHVTKEEYEPIFAFTIALMILFFMDIVKNFTIKKWIILFIRTTANYSYTLYLTHYTIFYFIDNHLSKNNNPYILFVIGFVLSNIVSFIMGHLFENIMTKKIKKLLYSFVS